jgi:hypothetical protein
LAERQDDEESDIACVVCGKLIKQGEGRFLIKDGAAHLECYEERKNRPAKA